MSPEDLNALAASLYESRTKQRSREQLTSDFKDLTLAEAYQIQKQALRLRQDDGETLIGMKMGLTSEAKRKQMGLDSPCYGHLTDQMKVASGESLSLSDAIHPKVEAEVAFFFNEPISHTMSEEELLSKCDGIAPALEVLDTRYKAFKYFSIEDVVADNSSSFKYVIGEPVAVEGMDLKALKLQMKINGDVVEEGFAEAISGNPIRSVKQFLDLAHQYDQPILSPLFILAGAATPAVTLEPNMKVELEVTNMKPISFTVTQ